MAVRLVQKRLRYFIRSPQMDTQKLCCLCLRQKSCYLAVVKVSVAELFFLLFLL